MLNDFNAMNAKANSDLMEKAGEIIPPDLESKASLNKILEHISKVSEETRSRSVETRDYNKWVAQELRRRGFGVEVDDNDDGSLNANPFSVMTVSW